MKEANGTLRDYARCPWCEHLSTLGDIDGDKQFFYCQNPKCSVERIYGIESVMVSGAELKGVTREKAKS